MARLKQAKEEAEKEIAAFRAQMEFEFQKKVAEVTIKTKLSLKFHPYRISARLNLIANLN